MGMAVFTDHLIDAPDLTRTQLSMAYLLGTVCSSLFLPRAGRWYDRVGGRVMVASASGLLAATTMPEEIAQSYFLEGQVVGWFLGWGLTG